MFKSNIAKANKSYKKRSYLVLISFLLFACFLLSTIFRLGFIMHDYYNNKAFDQITTTSKLKAERGNIYDSDMNLLATTKTVWRIFVSPKRIALKEKEDKREYASVITKGLSEILNIPYDTLYKKVKNSKVLDVTVKNSVGEDDYKRVNSFIKENLLDDLVFTEAQTSRYYPEQTLAAHVLGFTGSDNQGLYGLEYYYNSTLAGTDGYYLYAKDAGGNAMPGEYNDIQEATDGLSLVTTIDTYVQKKLEEQLETIRIEHSVSNRVTGIVMDTSSGAILAMATSSPFDPNSPFILDSVSEEKLKNSGYAEGSEEYSSYKRELMQIMWSNKAVSETYEPGSTFKIVTVSAALDLGVADMNDTFSCKGYHTIGGWRIKCHKTTGHGSGFPLSYGLQMSCNPTMMMLAERIGPENFYSYVEKFGYLQKTGIDLPSEASTIFHEMSAIGSTELATASFGQRFKVSIISQLTAIAAVANGGVLVEPYLVERIIDKNGNVVSEHKTVTKGRVISEEVAKTVADVLEKGVSGDGGAKNAYVDGYMVAAKTGTSQKFDILDANGNSYLRIGSTVAFAPSNDSGIAIIIVVDEPQGSVKYGSVVAAPYISNVLCDILPYLNYKSNKESSLITLENYVGKEISDATRALTELDMEFVTVGNGSKVIRQIPEASTEVLKSISKIYLYTEDCESGTVTVPALCGLSAAQANVIAASCGLNIRIDGGMSASNSTLTVTSQSLPSGAKVPEGTVIVLTVMRLDFED